MNVLFMGAASFNSNISRWDVARVTDMNRMFMGATSFDSDISDWDVSRVNDMSSMLQDAILFNQQLWGDAWVHSMASQALFFERSSESISSRACPLAPLQATR